MKDTAFSFRAISVEDTHFGKKKKNIENRKKNQEHETEMLYKFIIP